jgi:hypothetical protein
MAAADRLHCEERSDETIPGLFDPGVARNVGNEIDLNSSRSSYCASTSSTPLFA